MFLQFRAMTTTKCHLITFTLSLLVDVSFGASTTLETSINDCISSRWPISLQLAVDDLTNWSQYTTHSATTNVLGSIWKLQSSNCDGLATCICLTGAGDASYIGEHVWIEQILNVSNQIGNTIKIGVDGWTSGMNNAGEHGWVKIGCNGNMDEEFVFNLNDEGLTHYTTCSVIQSSTCNPLTLQVGGEINGYGDQVYVNKVYIQYPGPATKYPTSNPSTPTVSPTSNPSTPTVPPTSPTQFPTSPTQLPTAPSISPTQLPTTATLFPSVAPFYPLLCVIRYKDKSWASWYRYKLPHALDYADVLQDGLDGAFEMVFGHSIMYSHLDSWADKTWARAGIVDIDFCRFSDIAFNVDCPMFEAHGEESVAVAVFGVVADRNVVDYVKYLRQVVRGELFEYEFGEQVNHYLDNITLDANNFEIVSIDIIDPINVIFSTESASVTTMETEADTTDTIDTTDGNDSTYNSFGFIDYLIAGCVSFVCCLICVVCGCYFCTKHGQSQKNAEIIAIQSGDGTIPDVQNTEMTENVTDNADHLDQMADMAVLPDDPDDEHVPPPGGGGDADESDEEGEGNVDEEGGEGNADESCEENESDCVELRAWMKRPVGLEQYTEMMIYSGYRNMKDLEVMTLDDLKEMGVRKVAHRRKIY
eukprot:780379_1